MGMRRRRRRARRRLGRLSRRELVKMGLLASGAALWPLRWLQAAGRDDDSDDDSVDDDDFGGGPDVIPFERDLPLPEVLEPVTEFSDQNFPDPACSLEVPGFGKVVLVASQVLLFLHPPASARPTGRLEGCPGRYNIQG